MLLLLLFPFNAFLGDTYSAWIQHFFCVIMMDYVTGGAQVNPSVSIASTLYGWNNFKSMIVRVVAQMAGGIYAFPIMTNLMPGYVLDKMGGPVLGEGVTVAEGCMYEFLMTMTLMVIIYIAATQVGLPSQRVVIATAIRALIYYNAGKSGPAMNPMIALSWAFYTDKSSILTLDHFLIYHLAPTAGAVAATLLWKGVEPKPKAKSD
ncbi:unnamed protein product [Choristocarpus tenellus]